MSLSIQPVPTIPVYSPGSYYPYLLKPFSLSLSTQTIPTVPIYSARYHAFQSAY